MPNTPKYLLIHTSASAWGTVADIDQWHKERGWEGIGYHWVITNPFPSYRALKDNKPVAKSDGAVAPGRPEDKVGAHCPGFNTKSLGICLIGVNGKYTPSQIETLYAFASAKMAEYGIPPENVLGHGETENGKKQGKTCPDLDMRKVRAELKRRVKA